MRLNMRLSHAVRRLLLSLLQGVDPGGCNEVFYLILSELAALHASGFNASAIEAAVNTIEFALRYIAANVAACLLY